MPNTLKAKSDALRRMAPGDRLYPAINDLLIILSALAHATSVLIDGQTHRSPKPAMRVKTRWPNYGFALPLRGPLEYAMAGKIPIAIEIGIITTPSTLIEPMPNVKLETGGLQGVITHTISPIFLMFFERYNVWLDTNHGDAANWPPTLNFARVVRNAIAHGKITFRNPNAPPVSWRDFTYGPANNGEEIIGLDKINLGEMLALMFDVDDNLSAINAPIL